MPRKNNRKSYGSKPSTRQLRRLPKLEQHFSHCNRNNPCVNCDPSLEEDEPHNNLEE